MPLSRDGYLSTLGCVDFPAGGAMDHDAMDYKPGAMGVHFINMALVGPKLDSTKPQVLLYEPVGDKLVLTGAEWFVPTDVSKTPPTILRASVMGPMEGHRRVMPAAAAPLGPARVALEGQPERNVQPHQLGGEVPEDGVRLLVHGEGAEDCEAVRRFRFRRISMVTASPSYKL